MSATEIAILAAFIITPLVIWLVWPSRTKESRETLLARTFGRILDGERNEVLAEMRNLYQKSGQDVGVGLALGMLLRFTGKNQVAIRTHRSLTVHKDLEPGLLALIHTELAADYLEVGLLERARASLDEARKLREPDERIARYGERILSRLGEWDEAFKLVNAYAKSSGKNLNERLGLLRYYQGESLWRQENYDEAMTAYKKAYGVHDKCLPAYLAVCRLHRQQDKPSKALSFLKKKAELFEGKQWLVMDEFKRIAMDSGDHRIFMEAVHQRITAEPEDWRSRAVLGIFLTETGEYDDAAKTLLTCLEQAPQVLWLHQRIWSLMLRQDRPMEMFRVYQIQVREDLAFSDPYECRACKFHSNELMWRCPSCHREYSFIERKV